MGHAMQTPVFGYMRTAKAKISLRIREVDQGLRCPITESLDTIECNNGEQMPGGDFAHAWNVSESAFFACSQTHFRLVLSI